MIFRQSFNSEFTIYMILQGWCFQKKNNGFLLLLFWHTVSLEYLSRSINELQIKPSGNVSRPKFCHLEQVPPSLAPDDTNFLGFFPHSSGQPFSASFIELPFSTFVEKLTQLSSPLLLYILSGLHFSCLWLQWLIFFVFGWRGLIFIFSSEFPLKSVFQILNASYIYSWMPYRDLKLDMPKMDVLPPVKTRWPYHSHLQVTQTKMWESFLIIPFQ